MVADLKYCLIVSANVERSNSIYNHMLGNCCHSLTESNITSILVANSSLNSLQDEKALNDNNNVENEGDESEWEAQVSIEEIMVAFSWQNFWYWLVKTVPFVNTCFELDKNQPFHTKVRESAARETKPAADTQTYT